MSMTRCVARVKSSVVLSARVAALRTFYRMEMHKRGGRDKNGVEMEI